MTNLDIEKLEKQLKDVKKKQEKLELENKTLKEKNKSKVNKSKKNKKRFTLHDNFIDIVLMTIFISTLFITVASLLILIFKGTEPVATLDNWFKFVVGEVMVAGGIKVTDKIIKLKSGRYNIDIKDEIEESSTEIDYDLEL